MGVGVEGLFVVGLMMENGVCMPNENRNKLECNRVVVWRMQICMTRWNSLTLPKPLQN